MIIMTYREAKKVKVGSTLLRRSQNFKATRVLEISEDVDAKAVFFRCTDGLFHHEALCLPMPIDELVERYIRSPKTRVYIDHNNELGQWLYSVVVEDSDAFWLDSFDTEQEALDYIRSAKLKLADSESDKRKHLQGE